MISSRGCTCLFESENNLSRSQHCFMPCAEQYRILEARRLQSENNIIKEEE